MCKLIFSGSSILCTTLDRDCFFCDWIRILCSHLIWKWFDLLQKLHFFQNAGHSIHRWFLLQYLYPYTMVLELTWILCLLFELVNWFTSLPNIDTWPRCLANIELSLYIISCWIAMLDAFHMIGHRLIMTVYINY